MTSQRLPFDPLVATASDLQSLLDGGSLTSEDLINAYLAQIERQNHFSMRLNAVISTAPRDVILTAARVLDRERRDSGKRGLLYGIPIVLKVRFRREGGQPTYLPHPLTNAFPLNRITSAPPPWACLNPFTDGHAGVYVKMEGCEKEYIYIVGGVGLPNGIQTEGTQVFALDLDDFSIEHLHTIGDLPPNDFKTVRGREALLRGKEIVTTELDGTGYALCLDTLV